MQQYATSIYEDRLMPSTYLYSIREHLDGSRKGHSSTGSPEKAAQDIAVNWSSIAGLIAKYEQTVLTVRERAEWNTFKKELLSVHEARLSNQHSEASYQGLFSSLDQLIAIQAVEGAHLNRDLSTALAGSSLMDYLEIVLLIIVGSATVLLIGTSGHIVDKRAIHRHSLN